MTSLYNTRSKQVVRKKYLESSLEYKCMKYNLLMFFTFIFFPKQVVQKYSESSVGCIVMFETCFRRHCYV